MTTGSDPLPLGQWQRLDWRFLLPTLAIDRLSYGGAVDAELASALRLLDETAQHVDLAPAGESDVVFVRRPTIGELELALSRLAPGGWICAEVAAGRSGRFTVRTLAGWQRLLRRRGLSEVTAVWCPPRVDESTRMVRLDQVTAVDRTLDRHHNIRFGAQVALVGRLLIRLRLFGFGLPDGILVGRRPAGPS